MRILKFIIFVLVVGMFVGCDVSRQLQFQVPSGSPEVLLKNLDHVAQTYDMKFTKDCHMENCLGVYALSDQAVYSIFVREVKGRYVIDLTLWGHGRANKVFASIRDDLRETLHRIYADNVLDSTNLERNVPLEFPEHK